MILEIDARAVPCCVLGLLLVNDTTTGSGSSKLPSFLAPSSLPATSMNMSVFFFRVLFAVRRKR